MTGVRVFGISAPTAVVQLWWLVPFAAAYITGTFAPASRVHTATSNALDAFTRYFSTALLVSLGFALI